MRTLSQISLKVFRPSRWSREELEDEVAFLEDLREAGVRAVRPIGGIQSWKGLHHLAYELVPTPYEEDKPVFTHHEVEQFVDLAYANGELVDRVSRQAQELARRIEFDPVEAQRVEIRHRKKRGILG